MNLDFSTIFNDLKRYDFDDLREIRRAISHYGKTLNNVIDEYTHILDLMHDIIKYSERTRETRNFLKVGVYNVRKQNKTLTYYHIVSDTTYEFKNTINNNWVLHNVFELEPPRPITINRIVIDFDYWVLKNI